MNVPIWPGSSSFSMGETPFGFYDSDPQFRIDADKVATFCAQRLGYPITDVELQEKHFYTAFEEAITTYGNELYAYKIRDNQLSLEGSTTKDSDGNPTDLNNALITPSFEPIVRLTEMYGAEAGSGGNVPYYSGSFELTASVQDYSFQTFMTQSGYVGSEYALGIEVKKVFYEPAPAVVRYYNPYAGTGFGYQNLFDSFGFGGYSPAINFLMMPLNYDIQTIQAIEMNDMVRRSNYSFEIHNDKLRIFPIPTSGSGKIWFEYILRDERISDSIQNFGSDGGRVTNVGNTPYDNQKYDQINSVGRQWIFEYTLALAKEILGLVRGKYGTIPIPNADVTLNQSDLLQQAQKEKDDLILRLRDYFDETGRQSLLERRAAESDAKMSELQKVPYTIYIG